MIVNLSRPLVIWLLGQEPYKISCGYRKGIEDKANKCLMLLAAEVIAFIIYFLQPKLVCRDIHIFIFFFTHYPQVYYEIIIDVGLVISVLTFLCGHRDDQSSIPYQAGFLFPFSFSLSIATDSRLPNCDDRIDVL